MRLIAIAIAALTVSCGSAVAFECPSPDGQLVVVVERGSSTAMRWLSHGVSRVYIKRVSYGKHENRPFLETAGWEPMIFEWTSSYSLVLHSQGVFMEDSPASSSEGVTITYSAEDQPIPTFGCRLSSPDA